MVKLARKYLMSRVASATPGVEEFPWSKIKSKRNGLSGWTFIPLSMGGSSGGLKCTITPGTGKRRSSAWANGNGPKVLAKKAKITPKDITFLISKFKSMYKVYTIYFKFATGGTN
jgi:hypothetical protein